MDYVVQAPIPKSQMSLMAIKSDLGSTAEAFTQAFLRNSLPQMKETTIDGELQRKAVMLEYKHPIKRKGKTKKAKGLNARERRQLKVFQLKPEHQKYELFLPLHNLWKQYILDLCNGLKPDSNPQSVQQRLLKADFHGAVLTVVRSKCPSYVGLTGILVQELKHIFKLITKEDKLKVVPKKNSVFSVEVGDFVTHIYGNKFELRSSERSAKKFKVKGTIDL